MFDFKTILFLLLLIICNPFANASSVDTLNIITDRSLYVNGDQIDFALISADSSLENLILYADIQSSASDWMTGIKFRYHADNNFQSINIPQDLKTGIYFIRVYATVDSMINKGLWTIAPVKIVNPFAADMVNETAFSSGTNPVDHFFDKKINLKKNADYITLDFNAVFVLGTKYYYSIVPKTTSDKIQFETKQKPNLGNSQLLDNKLSIRGEINSATNRTPVQKLLFLSVPQTSELITSKTDSFGNFFFQLHDYENEFSPIISSADSFQLSDCAMKIFHEYALPIEIHCEHFSLTEDEQNAVIAMANNLSIRKAFGHSSIKSQKSYLPFYGLPDEIIEIDDYVGLQNLADYFTQLPYSARLKYKDKNPYFIISGNDNQMNGLSPLVLLDNVPVNNYKALLKCKTADILHFEVVKEVYIIGDYKFGGIISIKSKKGDYASYPFDNSTQTFKFQGLQSYHSFSYKPNLPESRISFSFQQISNLVQNININEQNCKDSSSNLVIRIMAIDEKGVIHIKEIPLR